MPVSTSTRPDRRLDQQAVERLEEAALVVDLVGDEAAPQDPRHRPEQRPGVGAERARLDQRDADAAAQVARPVDRVVHRHRATDADGLPGRAAGLEVAVERRRGRLRLALVLRPELGRAVRPLDRATTS